MSDKEERIRQRAYEKWQKEGETHGWHDRHWAEAEQEISAEDGKNAPAAKTAGRKKSQPSDNVTPMMDDAGAPSDDVINSDAGAAASRTAATGVDAKTRNGAAKAKPAAAKAAKPVAAKATRSGKTAGR